MSEVIETCQRCGQHGRLVFAHYNKNIGLGFIRRTQSIQGRFCPYCIRLLFFQYFFTCLLLGWWGVVSAVTNPFRILFNLIQYFRAEIKLGGYGRYAVCICIIGIIVAISVPVYNVFTDPMRNLQSLANSMSTQLEDRISHASHPSSLANNNATASSVLVVWSGSSKVCTDIQALIPVVYWPTCGEDIDNGYLIGITETTGDVSGYGEVSTSIYSDVLGYQVVYDVHVIIYKQQNEESVEIFNKKFPGAELPDSISLASDQTIYYGDPPSNDTISNWIMSTLIIH